MTKWTLRARLTAVYGALFFLAGTTVLGVTYWRLRETLIQPTMLVSAQELQVTYANKLAALPPAEREVQVAELTDTAERAAATYRQEALASLLRTGLLALGGVGLASVGGGWLLARRALRPLGAITRTARRVAEQADRNLHERIALDGPRDEVRELAETFNEMLERLDRSFDGQRRFVSNASHEMRTPLAINRTVIEVAMGRPGAPPEVRQLGEVLLEVNSRHERLIDGLLTLARSDRTVTDPSPVNLAGIAGHVLDRQRIGGPLPGAPVGVTVERELDSAPTVGDPVLLERLAENLVHNAVRYNTDGGWASVRTATRGDACTLTVSNTGPVIAAHEIPTLFEPFRRLTDRVGSAKGHGLGLSIVASVARAHHGDVQAVPRDGGGLVVTVTLPADHSVSSPRAR